ncbi:MAG: HypC/HybG/HupF family hydrogenase formation chaperone [Planctomycetales bacterium]|nr:HypC/HybG/HupF family hydrogenase formation chaperone [Planctomycetales bacterium]NIM10195.1 HypC/HybG/HupF family hydrogenase formation chaperone [Planctomycetales bacterium]NIN09618.1 HypC/HybG/HupF family hydrogenase formation chaperone [Planctomycetales bacterium]NIN78744.1 HypC/HybG/HupF family hydrogenase formation chaperone [Planctomycetales bacterium]NIO35918.1 HypC/HybG/HupF family hydrogenase formation chaperone [Planctomycetales bacterium]
MCLAVPARVVAIDDQRMATVELAGVARQVALDLLPETAVGDYVIVHVGFAIQRLDQREAEQTLSLWDELVADHQPSDS